LLPPSRERVRGSFALYQSHRLPKDSAAKRLRFNPYIRLTRELNDGRLRTILASGQAVFLYRLAIMSNSHGVFDSAPAPAE